MTPVFMGITEGIVRDFTLFQKPTYHHYIPPQTNNYIEKKTYLDLIGYLYNEKHDINHKIRRLV